VPSPNCQANGTDITQSSSVAARLWEQLYALVTDWAQVVDAHGAVGRVPLLLDQVEREEAPEAWDELWDRLCLHDETVSAASFGSPTLGSSSALTGKVRRVGGGGGWMCGDVRPIVGGVVAEPVRVVFS
jgi:hypothetical protein